MTRKKPALRPVGDDERKPEPEPALTLPQAVETGDYRKILVAQRREIAASIPEERGPAKAALHRQLSLIAKEIQALDQKAKQEAGEDAELSGEQAWDEEAI